MPDPRPVPGRTRRRQPAGTAGHTLIEVLIVLVLAAVVAAMVVPGREWLEALSIQRAGDRARSHLTRARGMAVGRRETLRVRMRPDGALLLLDPRDSVLAVTALGGEGLLRLDSLRLRPATLRFNSRGQASPGSLSLYRGDREVRLVSNFLGRLRRTTRNHP